MIDFCVKVFGNFCNSSPVLQIVAESQVLWCGEICGYAEIRCQIPTEKPIIISGIAKVNGQQGVYDTYVDEQGSILNDKWLRILDISIDGISMEPTWLNNLDFISDADRQKFQLGTFWSNGKLCFSVQEPILDWIIENKYIQFGQNCNFFVDAKSGQDRFDYQPMIKQIQKIKSILNDSDFNL